MLTLHEVIFITLKIFGIAFLGVILLIVYLTFVCAKQEREEMEKQFYEKEGRVPTQKELDIFTENFYNSEPKTLLNRPY